MSPALTSWGDVNNGGRLWRHVVDRYPATPYPFLPGGRGWGGGDLKVLPSRTMLAICI